MSSPAHGPCLSGLGELWRGNIIYRVPQIVSQRSEMQSKALQLITLQSVSPQRDILTGGMKQQFQNRSVDCKFII